MKIIAGMQVLSADRYSSQEIIQKKYLNKYPFAAMVPLAHENDQSVQNTEGISEEEAEVLLQRWGL